MRTLSGNIFEEFSGFSFFESRPNSEDGDAQTVIAGNSWKVN